MPITRLTAYTIATRDDIVIDAGGPAENGKFVGWITLGPEDRYRPLLNSEPLYDTKEEAKAAMHKVVEEVRQAVKKECGDQHPIDHVLGEHAGPVKAILQGVADLKRGANDEADRGLPDEGSTGVG